MFNSTDGEVDENGVLHFETGPLGPQVMRVGSLIEHTDFMGFVHRGRVEAFDDEKNGSRVVDVDNGKWCYLDQIRFVQVY